MNVHPEDVKNFSRIFKVNEMIGREKGPSRRAILCLRGAESPLFLCRPIPMKSKIAQEKLEVFGQLQAKE